MAGLERLREAIDEVLARDPAALSGVELVALAVGLDRELGRLTVAHARVAAQVEASKAYAADGSKSAAARLARECRRPKSACARAVRLGRSLRQLQGTGEALHVGEIGVEHAEELARCRVVAPDVFDAAEATLLDFARTLRFDDFLKACAYWRQVVDPDGADRDADRAVDDRFLRWHRRRDGSVLGEFQLDPLAGAAFVEALERIEQQFFRADWAAAKTERGEDVRTPGQIVPLLDRAELERIVFGPRNRVIELSERARFFTGGLRRAIQLRDRRCQWPGCDMPAVRCDIDHEIAYADGGLTTQANGRCFCDRHNQYQERQRALRQPKRQHHRSEPRPPPAQRRPDGESRRVIAEPSFGGRRRRSVSLPALGEVDAWWDGVASRTGSVDTPAISSAPSSSRPLPSCSSPPRDRTRRTHRTTAASVG